MPIDRRARRSIAARFDNPMLRAYIAGKLASDPLYDVATAIVRERPLPVLDIGCGIGLLGHYLHTAGALESYVGVDHDIRKIDAGRTALRRAGLDASMDLIHADATSVSPAKGHVAMLDVLHYLPAARQPELLAVAASHLAPDGCLILRNVVRERNWRFRLTVLEEVWLRASGLIRGGAQYFPDADDIRRPLEAAGLQVDMRRLHGITPFNSFLIVARHPA
jgi:cyclopropane fatty-acyl-phospholipid synthase-like methyltransferase